jgi:hypothetical protein
MAQHLNAVMQRFDAPDGPGFDAITGHVVVTPLTHEVHQAALQLVSAKRLCGEQWLWLQSSGQLPSAPRSHGWNVPI